MALNGIGDGIRKIANATQKAVKTAVKAAERMTTVQPERYSWSGKDANQMTTLEKTAYLRKLGKNDMTRSAASALAQEMQTVGSRHYSPYSTGKSNQKEAMAFFGLDSFDQNWLDENRFLLNYTTQLDHTDSISTSGQAKWSNAQKAGYYYQMLSEAEKTTQAAENEWAQLRSSMQQNFNEYKRLYGEAPSYEKLMSYIDMGDYSTLQKMDKVYENVEDLVRLNRSVEYTPETMLGVYAALVGGKDVTGDGDYFEEAVQYTMKPVQQPKQPEERADYAHWSDAQIEAKRQEIRRNGTRADLAQFEADLYASTPHLDSVDSTSFFSDTYYDQAFLDKYSYLGDYAEQLRNRDGKIEKPAASDPWWYGAAYEYDQIRSREEETKKAEDEWKALRQSLTASYSDEDNPEDVLENIDWDKYPTLEKLREGKDIDLNRAVYFSDDAIMGVLRAAADGEKAENDDFDYAFYERKPEVQGVVGAYGPEIAGREGQTFVSVPTDDGELAVDNGSLSTYFQGPSAYDGQIEDIDYDKPYDEKEPDIQEPPTGMNPEDFKKKEPYQFNPDAYFSGLAQTPEAIAADEKQETEAEETSQERQSFMDNLWQDMTANAKIDPTMIEKQFYEAQGRPMTQEERVAAGLTPRSVEGFDPRSIQLGVMDEQKQSIFDDTYNSIAQRYDYENMDELIANDPALLSNMLDYIETEPRPQNFSTEEVEHLKLLKKYQDDLDNGTLDEMFRAYADENATDKDRLNGAINYIIESGLTLEEKGALGLLNDGEDTQLIAERADRLFGEKGGEMARAMAISLLGTDADEGALKVMEGAISHLFAFETGVAGGLMESQMIGFNAVRDLWSAVAAPMYEARLGEGYTLDQACEIDPMLRGLTAAVDKGNALTGIASPDMSNFNYGAQFTQFITKSAIDQKMSNFYAPVGQGIASAALKKLKLGSLPEMLLSDNKLKSAFGKIINATSGATPWMLRSMSQNAQTARDMGASESAAVKYGMYSAGTTGLIEGVIGQAYDGLLGKGSNVLTKGLSKLTKGGMDKLLQSKGVTYATNLLQQAFSESMEELAEMPLDKIGQSAFLGKSLAFTDEDMKETWDGMRLSFVSSLFTSAFFGLSADQGTKLYTDSEKVLDRIVNGQASVDEMMEYAMYEAETVSHPMNAEPADADAQMPSRPALIANMAENSNYVAPEVQDQIESNYAVRDSVRIMHEQQTAMDNAAIDMAAEEVVEQQIAEGAMDDLIGPASPNAKTIATHEVNLQALMQKAQQEVEQMELLDKQKEAAIYTIISNGLSPEKGAARQMIHNFDEAKAAAQRRYDEWNQKLMDEENALQLERDHIQAQVDQRHKEMLTTARADVQQRWEQAKQKADQLVIEMDSQKTEPKKAEMAVTTNPELAEGSLADQIIGVETGEDPYDYFSAKEKSGEAVSQTEANRIAHHAGTDIQPDVELDSGDGDGYWPIDGKQKMLYEAILQEFPNEGWHFDKASLFKTEWDGDNRDEDPIADLTNRALVTVAKTADNEYILVKDTEKANQQGTDGAYLLLKKPNFSHGDDSAINKEAQHIMDAMDIRLNELSGKADQLKEQGIYGVDIDQTEDRINALRKLRQQASSFILSGRHRALVDKLNNLIARENDNRIGTQEVRKILESIPQSEEASFSLDDYVVGRYGKQNEAMHAITQMEKGVRKVSHRKPTTKVSIDLLNAIPDPEQFMHEMKYGDFDIEEFAAANPKLFGEQTKDVDGWTPEDLSKRYDSKLAHDNPNYAVIDNSNGFNLVVKSNRIQLDPNDTGRHIDTNLGIHTVSDAVQAIQKQLVKAQKNIEIERSQGNVREHDPMRLIYTVYDENGQPVNKTYQDYVDPATGQPRIPTVRELLANSSRITVNWPTKQVQLAKGGKWITTQKLEFTLERSDLAPNAYDPKSPDASRVLVQAELRRAEKEYEDHLGAESSSSGKLRYFSKVCEANINSYLQAINQLSEKVESGNITDAELNTARQNMTECYEALQTWQYAADRVSEAQDAKNNEHSVQIGADKIMKLYDSVLKKVGHASLNARLKLAANFRKAMDARIINDLMASMPKGTTIETLMARDQELQGKLEEIMNARNQAAVLNYHSPSALNSEPLAQAIMEEQNVVRQQMLLLPAPTEIDSAVQNEAPVPEIETSANEAEEVEGAGVEAAENGAEKPTEQMPENEAEPEAETADPVQKQQEMDRSYLDAVVNGSELIDMETGESVNSVDDVTGSEYAEAETGEIHSAEQTYPEEEAEDLSYATPVEEFMERAGLTRDYSYSAVITDPESHDVAEQHTNDAYKAVKTLTDRINAIQTALASGALEEDQVEAIQKEKKRYIDERNRIKAHAKVIDKALAESPYIGRKSINNIVRHCMETGDVDWEIPLVRAKQIEEIRTNEAEGIRKRLNSRMRAGSTTALTLSDVAEIIGVPELRQTLVQRNQVAWALRSQIRDLSEVVENYEAEAENIRKLNEEQGETTERMVQLARFDEYLARYRGYLENGQKAMRMFFDSSSESSLEKILSGAQGGKLPLPVMNRIFAMLQDSELHRKGSTNRTGILSNLDNPLRVIEHFTGEYAPIFNAIYIAPVQEANARIATEKDDIVQRLSDTGITADNEEIAFKYAEGKLNEVQFEELVPDPQERARIRYGVEVYHKVYDQLFEEVNAALKRNGFDEIKHRNNYVHHMSEAQGMIAKACSMLGIHIDEDTLPTAIAGQTENLKPRRKFMSAAMERHGDETSYALRRNTISYVESALRVIHQTDNISRLRQLEGVSLETENKAAVFSGLRQYGELTVGREGTTDSRSKAYSSLAEWVSRYTNGLAGKKTGYLDRMVENETGRNVLQIINGIKRYTGAAVTAHNLSVAASNILSVTTVGSIAPKATCSALMETIHAFRDHDWRSFEAKSDFLTARFGGKGMNTRWLDQFMEKGYVASEAVDRLAAHTAVRAFYKIGLDKGWSDKAAIKWADQMAWRMMSSRNVGESSNTMQSTVSSAILQFSREGINNLQFLMHDLPRYHDDKKKTWMSLLLLAIGNFLYNGIFNKETAIDPIGATVRSVNEWDTEESVGANLMNAAGNFAETLNPTNIGTGGAYGEGMLESIPMVSAVTDVIDGASGLLTAKNGEEAGQAATSLLSAALGFVPGSVSAERLLKGIGDLRNGYSIDKNGNIKYVLRTDEFGAGSVFDVIATALFGSSSSIGGRAYKARGYQAMSPSQTAAFHSQKNTGMSNQDAFNSVMGYAEETGNRNATAMMLPDWAAEKADTDWMKAVMEFGTGAYPQETPDKMTINGMEHQLTDEEKQVFVQKYRTAYRMYILDAMADGSNLAKAAEKAYSKAKSNFKKEMEE